MTTQEAIVAVLVAAIFANVVLAIGLVVGPRIRARREAAYRAGLHEAAGAAPAVAVQRASRGRSAMAGAQPVGSGAPLARESSTPGDRRAPGQSGRSSSPPPPTPRPGSSSPGPGRSWLAEEGARVDRYGHPATIVLVELAGVDRLAEQLGQEAADRLIPPIATTMRRHARAADNLARLGPVAIRGAPDRDRRDPGDQLHRAGPIGLRRLARVRAPSRFGCRSAGPRSAPKQPVEVAIKAAETRLNEERQRLRTQQDHDVEAGASTSPADPRRGRTPGRGDAGGAGVRRSPAASLSRAAQSRGARSRLSRGRGGGPGPASGPCGRRRRRRARR